ncbi:hypothetical protein [Streptomyces sp. NBC_01408]|uniref:hypothetical protein n=1 Tax=Streptomyces sp. NBC_01408 TaxID=2903855 RepID=UPI0022564CF8|nr:hypothetical protein [Streptomyces sp. NBC_01408]MCX4695888.1 phospholipase D family protein [Streptomyces sp. NBC_01408]
MTQPLVRPVAELFSAEVQALWATTYSLDLGLVNEFLLPRLGDPPLNVAVLADRRRLAADLARIPDRTPGTVATANSRWLLRGVHGPGAPGHAVFHPKSYLALARRGATLLVGSGNLTLHGLDTGNEVFTAFRSGTPVGDAAIAGWQAWMRRLVDATGDTVLAGRFQRLEAALASAGDGGKGSGSGPTVPSPLLHNLDVPIGRQLTEVVARDGGQVRTLWLTAPFYDEKASAVGRLLKALRPERVQVFVSPTTSVNGARLAERLTASGAQVLVSSYGPDAFVHAKLIGVECERRGWLLSGSANLSTGALWRRADEGNTELAVLAPAGPEQLGAVFTGPGVERTRQDLGTLTSLRFSSGADAEPLAVRLLSAAVRSDGRVLVRTEPPRGDGWALSDLTERQPLAALPDGTALTSGPLAGRLVEVVDHDGRPLSDRLIADDPVRLEAALTATTASTGPAPPAELDEAVRDSFLGRRLLRLNQTLIFDANDVLAPGGPGGTGETREPGGDGHTTGTGADSVWDRLKREELGRDPRAGTYERMLGRRSFTGPEPFLLLLDALRLRTPAAAAEPSGAPVPPSGSLLERLLVRNGALETEPEGEDPAGGRTAHSWTLKQRIRVRARNLLHRWATALADARLAWIDPLAPVVNFAALTQTLAELRLEASCRPDSVELTTEDLDEVWELLLRSFAGTGDGRGWLDRLDPADRDEAGHRLSDWLDLPEAVAALCWLAVRPGHVGRERKIALQPLIGAALDHGLLNSTKQTGRYLSLVTGTRVRRGDVDDRLLEVMDFIDDPLWCRRRAEELGLAGLELETTRTGVKVTVRGVSNPLTDPRIPKLVLAARLHSGIDGVSLFDDGERKWRLSLFTGEPIAYLPSFGTATYDALESALPLRKGDLESAHADEASLAAWFTDDTAHHGPQA